MTIETIINLIKESKALYLVHVEQARTRLKKRMDDMTSHQISTEMLYIQDMESRAYAMQLLLEEIEELQ